ncbi:methyl-accepting chemotaxis protein [Solirubrobacter pauli]|uniref:Methyl-accepting chemotaxis protein n=1 Tax=Solirubrobacter pauli TaxID=166793 RepID=A0A660L054_9ACTN|nr:methyl-accepting chemotaxis protein [Solirubrobacter pauli]RKQ86808.1 methyl-accepting chemotaxis protein [Solirubrobacter pauli]
MQLFRNLRLSVRLGAVFGTVAAGLLILAVFGVRSLGSEYETAERLGHKDIPAVKNLGSIQFAMVAYRADQLAHAHQTDDAGRADQESQMAEHDAIMQKAFQQYEGLYVDEQDRKLAASAKANWEAYKTASAAFLPLSRKGDHAGAYAVLKREVGPLVALIGDLDQWIAFAEKARAAHVQDAKDTYVSARTVLIALAIALALLSAAAVWLVTRSVTRPVHRLRARLHSLNDTDLESLAGGLDAAARGDFTRSAQAVTEPVEVEGRDELGELSAVFNEMIEKSRRGVTGYDAMRAQLGEMIGEVASTAATVATASEEMAGTSNETGRAVHEIASAVGDVAEGTERQVRMVESVRDAAQHAARIASESASSARETAEAASRAREVADEGAEAARVASTTMGDVARNSEAVSDAIRELADRSERIGTIVEAITGLAQQTNLLALNAAIEAARAGEQGKGFAVVAEEVRKLAEESQTAAASISTLIEEIQNDTGRVVEVVEAGARRTQEGVATVEHTREALERIGGDVQDMHTRVSGIVAAVDEISAATERMQADVAEVAAVAEQSSASTEEVSASTQQTSASAQEIAAGAAGLAQTADQLEALVSRFRVAT